MTTKFLMCLSILGWFWLGWFIVFCVVEQHPPKFWCMFTRVSRLERKRDRLKDRIAEMKGLKAYREQIKDLEKALGEETFNKPQEFLDTE